MPESSSDKSTRKFISNLSNAAFNYQISIFYDNYSDRLKAPDHKPIITDLLPRMFPDKAFLYRLVLNNVDCDVLNDLSGGADVGETVLMPYHTVFTTGRVEIDSLEIELEKRLGCELRLKRRVFNDVSKQRYISALKGGEPHDLLAYFSDLKSLRRSAVIGKKYL